MPDWWVWTGGWYELDGEANYYTNWDCLTEKSTVFDVGGFRGEWTKRIHDKYKPTIHFFEPADESYNLATSRLGNCSNIHLWNFGLGSKCGIFRLYDPMEDGASFYKTGNNHVHAKIENISKFLRQQELCRVDLMSLNTEGAEYEILPYLIGTGEITMFDRLMIQWHSIFENAAALQLMIQETMSRTHRMIWNLGAWEAWIRKGI
jgi:FkbM family methyltransferase